MRGRGSELFREWFFHNPISFLRECDGDRCEFWRFRYPGRRVQASGRGWHGAERDAPALVATPHASALAARPQAMNVLVEQARTRFPPSKESPLIISSFGSGLLYQEFCHLCKLVQVGYTHFRLLLVDTAYAPWKQKYLARDGCCRIYCQPASARPPPLPSHTSLPPEACSLAARRSPLAAHARCGASRS